MDKGAEGWIGAAETRAAMDDGVATVWKAMDTRAGVADRGSARDRRAPIEKVAHTEERKFDPPLGLN